MHEASGTQESADIGERFAGQPVADTGYFGVIWNPAIIAALVSKDNDLWYRDEEFFGRDSGASMT